MCMFIVEWFIIIELTVSLTVSPQCLVVFLSLVFTISLFPPYPGNREKKLQSREKDVYDAE